MNGNEYQKLAMRTNDGNCTARVKALIAASYQAPIHTVPAPGELLNGALGITGEAGEVADLIKKHVFHGHDLNRDEIVKELGDVCWYVALLATSIGVGLDEILERNIEKLKRRYPEGFSSAASINRKI